MATPQMTWGEVEGTPLVLDRERIFKVSISIWWVANLLIDPGDLTQRQFGCESAAGISEEKKVGSVTAKTKVTLQS